MKQILLFLCLLTPSLGWAQTPQQNLSYLAQQLLSGGIVPATSTQTSGVTPGSYTCLNSTVDAYGRITSAMSGTCSGGGSMVYPGAGIGNSTGSAWGTSYSAGNPIPANFVSTLNQNTTGNAATATALSTTGSNNTFWGVSGGVQGYYTPAGGGNVSNTGAPTAGQFAEWTSATVIGGQTLTGDCTLATATITCTKTSGTSFGALATATPGTGVAAALAIAVGSAGAPVVNGGALGTPSSGVATNLTGTAAALSIGGNAATATTAGNLTGTPALPNGTTATTQTTGDSTTKLATDAFVIANASAATSITPGTTTVNGATAPCVIDNSASTTMGCATLAPTLAVSSGVLGTNAPHRTVTTSPTVASTDMGGVIYSNVTGGGTVTIPAISSTVLASGMSLSLVNYSASTAAISSTPTVNAGGGCISGTGIPSGGTWELVSNGTTIDCNQTVASSSGSMVYPGAGIPVSTGSAWSTSITPGTGVQTALGVAVGSAGAVVVNGGALGTPSGGTMTNLSGTPSSIGLANATAASLPLASIATIANNTVLGNTSGSTASPTAQTTVTYLIDGGTKMSGVTGTGGCSTPTVSHGGVATALVSCSGTTGASTIVLTLPSATGGWVCHADDQTTANTLRQSANTTTSSTISGTINTGDVIALTCTGMGT